jgi:hypothetical protein
VTTTAMSTVRPTALWPRLDAEPLALSRGLSSDPANPCAEPAWLAHYVGVGQRLLALATGDRWTPGALDRARAVAADGLPYERPDWVCGYDEVGDLWALLDLYDRLDDPPPAPDPTPAQVRSAVWNLLGEVAYDLGVRFGDLPGEDGAADDLDPLAVAQLAILAATATADLILAERDAAEDAAEHLAQQTAAPQASTSGGVR